MKFRVYEIPMPEPNTQSLRLIELADGVVGVAIVDACGAPADEGGLLFAFTADGICRMPDRPDDIGLKLDEHGRLALDAKREADAVEKVAEFKKAAAAAEAAAGHTGQHARRTASMGDPVIILGDKTKPN